MKRQCKVSIIIRAKNEEKWISSCLSSVFLQEFKDFEIILVDNCSTDGTVEKARSFPVNKIVTTEQFLPGKALNLGIRHSKGQFIVCLSAHCIPTSERWLGNFLASFNDDGIAGVYGRQEPMAFSSDMDKRDLINIFGLDRKVQKKDPFFHNANSMIRRDIWEEIPFSETTTNIEDRLWAIDVLEKGYRIVYEPEASVYHYHGINQGRNVERAKNVVRILEEIHPSFSSKNNFGDMKTTAIIPVRSPVKRAGPVPLLELAVKSLKTSRYITRIIVAADNREHMGIAEGLGVKPVMRPKNLSYDYIELIKVYQYVLQEMLDDGEFSDFVFLAQEKYPFRPPGLIDRMIERLIHSNSDSVIASGPVYNSLWREHETGLMPLDEGLKPTKYKEPVMMAFFGLGCVMTPHLILQGEKIGRNAGLMLVENPYSAMTATTEEELKMVEALLPRWYDYINRAEKDHDYNRDQNLF